MVWAVQTKHSVPYVKFTSPSLLLLFCLNRHSDVYYCCYFVRNEENALFNDALNTFCSRLYGVRHMVKVHSDSERGNPAPPHGLLFLISSKGSFICIIPQTEKHTPLSCLGYQYHI